MSRYIIYFLLVCMNCVPYSQQLLESEQEEISGYVGPLVIDEEKFYQVVSREVFDKSNIPDEYYPSNNKSTYWGTMDGKGVYIKNCKCFSDPKVIQDKLVVTHRYSGGSNRESTLLLWSGSYYKNAKGEIIVDLKLHSDVVDVTKILTTERKVHDIKALQLENEDFIWINLIGYDGLIPYVY